MLYRDFRRAQKMRTGTAFEMANNTLPMLNPRVKLFRLRACPEITVTFRAQPCARFVRCDWRSHSQIKFYLRRTRQSSSSSDRSTRTTEPFIARSVSDSVGSYTLYYPFCRYKSGQTAARMAVVFSPPPRNEFRISTCCAWSCSTSVYATLRTEKFGCLDNH